MLFPEIELFIRSVLTESDRIPVERQKQLLQLADYLQVQIERTGAARLHFICTHNSRRSHLGQIWAAVCAAYFGISNVQTYSGGTEATALNPRVVTALERVGFQIRHAKGDNPKYQVHFAKSEPALSVWSKTYDDPINPRSAFAAIMTCSDADERCPFIPGAALRLPLIYQDPKEADGTPQEAGRYDERTRQIGREMAWTMQQLARKTGISTED